MRAIFFSLLICSRLAARPPVPLLPGCSRLLSREAARAATAFAASAAAAHVELLPGCPLNASASRFSAQEASKTRLKPRKWRCGLCGKEFFEEVWLDAHLHGRHGQGDGARPCLAEHCHALGCPSLEGGGGEGSGAACAAALRACVPASEAAFLRSHEAAMCEAPFARRAAVRRAADAAADAFQWTPQRAGLALVAAIALAVGLREAYLADVRDPIVPRNVRNRLARERAAAAEAAAAAAEAAAAAASEPASPKEAGKSD